MKEFIVVVVAAATLALLTMGLVFERINVPTASMEPTIPAGARVGVDKLAYLFHAPEPGDLIAFWHDEGNGHRVRVVKRLIALGGQAIQIKGSPKRVRMNCGDG